MIGGVGRWALCLELHTKHWHSAPYHKFTISLLIRSGSDSWIPTLVYMPGVVFFNLGTASMLPYQEQQWTSVPSPGLCKLHHHRKELCHRWAGEQEKRCI